MQIKCIDIMLQVITYAYHTRFYVQYVGQYITIISNRYDKHYNQILQTCSKHAFFRKKILKKYIHISCIIIVNSEVLSRYKENLRHITISLLINLNKMLTVLS